MQITKQSMFTGEIHTREIDVTEDQIRRWQGGELIQNVMPHLSPDDREFLMTGVTPEEWAEEFSEEEEEDEWDISSHTIDGFNVHKWM